MKIKNFLKLAVVTAIAVTALGCDDNNNTQPIVDNNGPVTAIPPAAVYTMTNDAVSNAVREYRRSTDGTLAFVSDYPTGASGSGDSLDGASGSLIHVTGTDRFFAVNAGSNSVTLMVMAVDGSLTPLSTANSGGTRPISVTTFGNTVYVLNAGDAGNNIPANISGLELVGSQLVPIAGSTQPLSVAHPNPAQIGFHPTGTVLVVTERDTNRITTYALTGNIAGTPQPQASASVTPFAFDFNSLGTMVLTGATNGVVGGSTVSSHIVGAGGPIATVTAALPTNQSIARGVEVSNYNPVAYITNSGSNNLSIVNVGAQNDLSLQGNGNTINTGATPMDLDLSDDGQFLYVLNAGDDTISGYSVAADGSLTVSNGIGGLPVNSVGIVVR